MIRTSLITLLLALLVSAACAATDSAPVAVPDAYAKAVIDCHVAYAHRYAKASSASPSEMAEGADAACWDAMKAYERHTADLVPAGDNMTGLAKDKRAKMAHELSRHAHALTIDTVIRETANEVLLGH
jgi:hypothetical protein